MSIRRGGSASRIRAQSTTGVYQNASSCSCSRRNCSLSGPETATWIRMLLFICELNRILSQLVFLGRRRSSWVRSQMFWYLLPRAGDDPRCLIWSRAARMHTRYFQVGGLA